MGLSFAVGLTLAAAAARRPKLADRVLPLVRTADARPGIVTKSKRPWWDCLAAPGLAALDSLFGAQNAASRISQAGLDWSVERFRLEQLRWAVLGTAFGVGAGLLRLASGRPLALFAWTALALVGAAGGACGAEQRLARAASRRRERIAAQVPTVAEMLAFTVSAGLAPSAAIARVARRSVGELGSELRRCCDEVAAGVPLAEALREVSCRTGVASVERLVDAFVIAIERGTPLAEVLRAQAMDSRAAGHRALMESAGRREVFALVPVVFLILPAVVLIAVFPGVYGLTINVP